MPIRRNASRSRPSPRPATVGRALDVRAATGATLAAALALGALATLPGAVHADEVGEIGVDWVGGDIIIEAIEDPKVQGVTCHVSYFERGLLDRVRNGEIFNDPSNSSIACRQTGPLVIGDIERDEEGEEVFSQRTSLVLKSLKVTRVYDEERETLIYLSHATEVKDGSAKMALSTVPLYGQEVRWED